MVDEAGERTSGSCVVGDAEERVSRGCNWCCFPPAQSCFLGTVTGSGTCLVLLEPPVCLPVRDFVMVEVFWLGALDRLPRLPMHGCIFPNVKALWSYFRSSDGRWSSSRSNCGTKVVVHCKKKQSRNKRTYSVTRI